MADIEFKRGDSHTLALTVTETDSESVTTAYDLTGCTVFFTAKNEISDTDAEAVLKKDTDTFSDPTSGEVEIEFEHADTLSLEGDYACDIQLLTVAGKVYTIFIGTMLVDADVTIRIVAE